MDKNNLTKRSELFKKQFDENGSDKSFTHDYHLIYSEVFPEDIDFFIEIGISNNNKNNSSLHAWSKIFPKSKIIGVDVVLEKLINENNISSYYIDQSSKKTIKAFKKTLDNLGINKKINIILDDGSHFFEHSVDCFEILFSSLRDDGIYAIEDIRVNENNTDGQQTVKNLKEYFDSKNIKYEIYYSDIKLERNPCENSCVFIIKRNINK